MLWAEFLAAENDVYYFRSPDLFDFLTWMPLFEKLSKLYHILAYFYPFKVVISSKLKLPAKVCKTMPPEYTNVIQVQKSNFPTQKKGVKLVIIARSRFENLYQIETNEINGLIRFQPTASKQWEHSSM